MTDPILLPDEKLETVNGNLRLTSKKQGLTYGTDAFLLAAFTKGTPHTRAVELGGGTGIVSLLLCSYAKAKTVTAVEIQEAFAELIDKNAALNGLSDRTRALCADLRELKASDIGGEVDLVVANPPYMRTDAGRRNERDEKYIARHEVYGTVADFCRAAERLLRYGGKFVTVWRPDRLTELLYALHEAQLEPKRMTLVHSDSEAAPCMVLTEAVKGAAPAMRLSPPLFLYEPGTRQAFRRALTPTAQRIYESCSFPDAFLLSNKKK